MENLTTELKDGDFVLVENSNMYDLHDGIYRIDKVFDRLLHGKNQTVICVGGFYYSSYDGTYIGFSSSLTGSKISYIDYMSDFSRLLDNLLSD